MAENHDTTAPACPKIDVDRGTTDRARAARAMMFISSSRTGATVPRISDEECIAKEGFRDMNEYWEVQLREPRPYSYFYRLLAMHFSEPDCFEGGQMH